MVGATKTPQKASNADPGVRETGGYFEIKTMNWTQPTKEAMKTDHVEELICTQDQR